MLTKEIFSTRLKLLRKQNNITMQTLATAVGKKRPAISQFELGTNLPSIDTLIAIANYFNVSIDYLLGLSDNPERK
jgi:transcriptional regulator with XRE-family HTH domain